MPVTFQEKISTYTDGTFYTYAAPDGETLVIHCGYDYQLPFLNETQFKVLGKSKSGRYGIVKRTKTYWREENFDNGLTIYYSNIHESNKQFFDKLIEGIIKTLNK
ncbi:MAG TPA: hypothetical protein PLX35_07420 [Cyclobacteriaceae bacterium]|nr:hypothetical protein [Cyclobacteriaceae bacterium]